MDEVLRKEIIDKHPAGKQGDGKQDKTGDRLQHHHPFEADQRGNTNVFQLFAF